MGHVEQRHEVQVGELLLLEVRDLIGKLLEIPGKQVGVHGHAEHVAALVPIRVLFAGLVETLQVGGTVSIGLSHAVDERGEGIMVGVQTHEEPQKFILKRCGAGSEKKGRSIKKELLPDVRFFGSSVGRTVHFDIVTCFPIALILASVLWTIF